MRWVPSRVRVSTGSARPPNSNSSTPLRTRTQDGMERRSDRQREQAAAIRRPLLAPLTTARPASAAPERGHRDDRHHREHDRLADHCPDVQQHAAPAAAIAGGQRQGQGQKDDRSRPRPTGRRPAPVRNSRRQGTAGRRRAPATAPADGRRRRSSRTAASPRRTRRPPPLGRRPPRPRGRATSRRARRRTGGGGGRLQRR